VKERDTLAWVDSFFRPGDVFYDVGANIGQYSLYAALRLKKRIEVLAFEPEALNHAQLNKNIVLNGLVGTVRAYALAVSDRTRLGHFYVKFFSPGAAWHAWGHPLGQGEQPFEPVNEQGTMAVSIDDLVDTFSLPCPNHIKVDVDGLEDRVVDGAIRTLSKPHLRSCLIEVFMYKDVAAKIQEVFSSQGFKLHNARDVDFSPGNVQNLIFTRS
jgi:FkbM family methyltransferase